MRLIALAGLAVFVVVAVLFWQSGAIDALSAWARTTQRELQTGLAGTIRALKAGEAAALFSLIAACGAYGFVHAAGPGHGKLVIGGASLASRETLNRMAVLALVSSLAQALVAIVLVYGAFLIFEVGARSLTDTADQWLAPLSYALIAAVGLVLAWRGGVALWRWRAHEKACGCGHAHGPSAEQAERALTWRERAILVATIAVRPCTGAIFVLAICWRLDLALAGALSVLAMGLGTALFTVLVAVFGVGLRGWTLFAGAGTGRVAMVFALIQIGAGMAVLTLSSALLIRSV